MLQMWSGGLAIIDSHHLLPRRATRQPAHATLAVGIVWEWGVIDQVRWVWLGRHSRWIRWYI